jgi:hypothetical protein
VLGVGNIRNQRQMPRSLHSSRESRLLNFRASRQPPWKYLPLGRKEAKQKFGVFVVDEINPVLFQIGRFPGSTDLKTIPALRRAPGLWFTLKCHSSEVSLLVNFRHGLALAKSCYGQKSQNIIVSFIGVK